jgi:PilZ domain
MPDRLYTRYPFSATAEIIDSSSAQMPSRVTNIGFGGCRLIATGRLSIGAEVTVKIHTPTEYFESAATVAHSTANDLGVMFHNVSPVYFNVLRRWISAITQVAVLPPASHPKFPSEAP